MSWNWDMSRLQWWVGESFTENVYKDEWIGENEIKDELIVHQIAWDADFIKQFGKDADLKNISIRENNASETAHNKEVNEKQQSNGEQRRGKEEDEFDWNFQQ